MNYIDNTKTLLYIFIFTIFSVHSGYTIHPLMSSTTNSLKTFAQAVYINITSRLYFTPKNSSSKNFHDYATYQVDENKKALINKALTCQETIAAFRYITRKNFIELPLIKTNEIGINAEYDYLNNSISLNEDLLKTLPFSEKLKIILHEFRHFQQNTHITDLSISRRNLGSLIIPEKLKLFYANQVITKAQQYFDASSKDYNPWWQDLEYDADYWATQQIHCPICLKILQSKTTPSILQGISQASYLIGDDKQIFGYFGFDDYTKIIQEAKDINCCPAHTLQSHLLYKEDNSHNEIILELQKTLDEMLILMETFKNDTLSDTIDSPILRQFLQEKESLYQKLYKKITDLDQKAGSFLQHLPNYNNHTINAINNKKKLWSTILNNEKKRKEIKALTESCNNTTK